MTPGLAKGKQTLEDICPNPKRISKAKQTSELLVEAIRMTKKLL